MVNTSSSGMLSQVDTPLVKYAGLALMMDGVRRWGGNVSGGGSISTDGGGNTEINGENPDTGERYPGSGGGGNGGGGSGNPIGGGGGNGFYATDRGGLTLDMTFYNRYSNYDRYSVNERETESINREMLPTKSRGKVQSQEIMKAKGLQYDKQGNIIGEVGIEADPLVDPTSVLGGLVQGLTRGTINATNSFLRSPAMARSTSKGIMRIFDAFRVRADVGATDLMPLNPEKIIINPMTQKLEDK